MKLSITKLFALFFLITFSFTIKSYGQAKANPNFTAGVAALDEKNMPLAFTKFLAAAKQGHIDSQYNVAVMYDQGVGVGKNDKEALNWYIKGAEQGNANCQFNLAVLYENGRGTIVDFAKANKWYRRAAMQGDGLAVGNLGMLYIRGQGVKVNTIAGIALLLLSTQMDQSPENTAKQNITATRGLNVNMVTEAQALSDKMSKAPNLLVPFDQYLKKSETSVKKK